MQLLDHVSIAAPDLDAARPFYDAVMAALGCEKVCDHAHKIGYGERSRADAPGHSYLSVYASPSASVDDNVTGASRRRPVHRSTRSIRRRWPTAGAPMVRRA